MFLLEAFWKPGFFSSGRPCRFGVCAFPRHLPLGDPPKLPRLEATPNQTRTRSALSAVRLQLLWPAPVRAAPTQTQSADGRREGARETSGTSSARPGSTSPLRVWALGCGFLKDW